MKTNMEAKTPLVNHKDTKAMMTRFEVTSSLYRRWRAIARSQSTAIAAIVKNEAQTRKDEKNVATVKIARHKKS